MVFLAIYAFAEGNFSKLTSTFNSEGFACGYDEEVKDYKYAYLAVPHADYLNKTMCLI